MTSSGFNGTVEGCKHVQPQGQPISIFAAGIGFHGIWRSRHSGNLYRG